jgi:hypothetical protein
MKRAQAGELLRLGIRQDGNSLVCARTDGEPMRPRSPTHEFTYLVRRLKRHSVVNSVASIRFEENLKENISFASKKWMGGRAV